MMVSLSFFLSEQLGELSEAEKEALAYIIKASMVIDDIFYEQVSWLCICIFTVRHNFPTVLKILRTVIPLLLQVWYGNPLVRDWLKEYSNSSKFDKLKWMYYSINKSPWYFSL